MVPNYVREDAEKGGRAFGRQLWHDAYVPDDLATSLLNVYVGPGFRQRLTHWPEGKYTKAVMDTALAAATTAINAAAAPSGWADPDAGSIWREAAQAEFYRLLDARRRLPAPTGPQIGPRY